VKYSGIFATQISPNTSLYPDSLKTNTADGTILW
jgi:hypothetical protein